MHGEIAVSLRDGWQNGAMAKDPPPFDLVHLKPSLPVAVVVLGMLFGNRWLGAMYSHVFRNSVQGFAQEPTTWPLHDQIHRFSYSSVTSM